MTTKQMLIIACLPAAERGTGEAGIEFCAELLGFTTDYFREHRRVLSARCAVVYAAQMADEILALTKEADEPDFAEMARLREQVKRLQSAINGSMFDDTTPEPL